MKCPKCRAGTKRTRVTKTEHCSDHTIRYCRCLECGNKWKTEEKIVPYMKRPYYHPKGGGFNAKLNHSKVKEIRAIAKENEKEAIAIIEKIRINLYDVDSCLDDCNNILV